MALQTWQEFRKRISFKNSLQIENATSWLSLIMKILDSMSHILHATDNNGSTTKQSMHIYKLTIIDSQPWIKRFAKYLLDIKLFLILFLSSLVVVNVDKLHTYGVNVNLNSSDYYFIILFLFGYEPGQMPIKLVVVEPQTLTQRLFISIVKLIFKLLKD